jgi:hypothetical protein
VAKDLQKMWDSALSKNSANTANAANTITILPKLPSKQTLRDKITSSFSIADFHNHLISTQE